MRLGERRARGFTIIGLLAVLVLLMVGLAQAGTWWSQDARREREQELLRIGAVYAAALASYHQRSPGSVRQYPSGCRQNVTSWGPSTRRRVANWPQGATSCRIT